MLAARPHARAQVPERRVAGESMAAPGDGCEREWQPGARRLERRHLLASQPNVSEVILPNVSGDAANPT